MREISSATFADFARLAMDHSLAIQMCPLTRRRAYKFHAVMAVARKTKKKAQPAKPTAPNFRSGNPGGGGRTGT
jgi:hypothetical protein